MTPMKSRIAEALRTVPRQAFVSSRDLEPQLSGHSIPSRATMRQILEALPSLPRHSRVLHVGAGSGYVAAVLARLFDSVVAIDRNPAMVELAAHNAERLSLDNLSFQSGDAEEAMAPGDGFDVILVTTFLSSMDALIAQLREGASLICLEAVPESPPVLVHHQWRSGVLHRQGILCRVDFRRSTEEALIDLGLLPEDSAGVPVPPGTTPIRQALKNPAISEREVYRQLVSTRRGLVLKELDALLADVDPALFARFSRSFLEHHRLIPVYQRDRQLYVVSDNPDAHLDAIAHLTDAELSLLLVTPTDFRRLWSHLSISERGNELSSSAQTQTEHHADDSLEASREGEVTPYLVSLYEGILLEAVSQQASDIHIERYGSRVRIRLRIDGELHDLNHYRITPGQVLGVVSIIKLRAELNIAERRLPQGGRSRLKFGDVHFDLRVQTQPSLHGEHVVIRLLRQTGRAMTMQELGMSAKLARKYQRLLDNPAGLILVVGPTGSGKSTTLYAGLQELADDGRRKVITVEDPIEYSIDNIQQTRVRPGIGFSFADAMRSFVRQDPDVILVGEIRDQETALEAIRASQTGHVVLSTLHCNDSVDALQRLYDLGSHPNSIASELLAVIAQRLAKRICPDCRQPATPDPAVMAELFPEGPPADFQCFEGKGCPHCKGRGTRGRVAVVEFLQVSRDVRNGISLQPPVGEMRSLALDAGLITMRDSALDHVIQGTIPLSELPRILPEDRMGPEQRGGRR
ncbi:ATPase, T2SS/T4P/T4SS family [Marinobacter lacisalsi]|uniref:ATPase, T2SS/T4P/T4SS family n=1 Tax=Marinobacter lacisalsi TaxID=475979 RepID=A0ABV8QLU5_9GAMM